MMQVRRQTSYVPLCPAGHGKCILDAHGDLRDLLATSGIHNYARQLPGPDHKVVVPCGFMQRDSVKRTEISFYRPITKEGTMSRFWIYGLPTVMSPGEVLGVHVFQGKVYAFNASDRDMVLRMYLGTPQ
jgi:hypothetical protein